jgi:glycosyltransferase involved in cell wall biosynthesis
VTRVHLVYPHGPSISCPDAIGRNVAQRLRQHFEVIQYEWDDTKVIEPGDADVLLGHPHPAPWTVFRRSARRRGWRRIIAMSPFCTDPRSVAFADATIARCDSYLAISGGYWFSVLHDSRVSHWAPKMIHVDLAVDRRDFPAIKRRFNAPGERRFLYIGSAAFFKNTHYLGEIAARMPGITFRWIGADRRGIRGFTPLGYQDFSLEVARSLVAEHDFMLTVGVADPNPTTILESMAWGLIPVCTPTSGYVGFPGIVNIPSDDVREAVRILRGLQATPELRLREMQAQNSEALDRRFNWQRFTDQVLEAVRSDDSLPLLPESIGQRVGLLGRSLASPISPFRLANLKLLCHRRCRVRLSRKAPHTKARW